MTIHRHGHEHVGVQHMCAQGNTDINNVHQTCFIYFHQYIGMKFDTDTSTYEFNKTYARACDFDIKICDFKKRNGIVH